MYPERPNNTKQKVALGISSLIVIALLSFGVVAYKNQSQSTASTASTTPTSATSDTTSVVATTDTTSTSGTTTSTYKDGTYTSTSSYYVPHGSETIKVTLTVKDGVVTDSQIVNSEGDHESAQYQEDFASEYKSSVVGKNIASIQLSYVAGASDTTQGFNDALAKIKSEAQA